MDMHVIFPLSQEEQERLKIENSIEGSVLGVMITPSRVREGVKRWQKHGCPDVFDGDNVSESVKVTQQVLSEQQAEKDEETKKVSDLQEKRIDAKNKKIKKLNNELQAEVKKVRTYNSHFGEPRSHPLNRFQRFIARLFKIIS